MFENSELNIHKSKNEEMKQATTNGEFLDRLDRLNASYEQNILQMRQDQAEIKEIRKAVLAHMKAEALKQP